MDFRMDVKSLSELLKGTIDPTVSIELKKNLITNGDNNSDNKVRNEAEKKLAEVHKIIGFGPVLLQVPFLSQCEIFTKIMFLTFRDQKYDGD